MPLQSDHAISWFWWFQQTSEIIDLVVEHWHVFIIDKNSVNSLSKESRDKIQSLCYHWCPVACFHPCDSWKVVFLHWVKYKALLAFLHLRNAMLLRKRAIVITIVTRMQETRFARWWSSEKVSLLIDNFLGWGCLQHYQTLVSMAVLLDLYAGLQYGCHSFLEHCSVVLTSSMQKKTCWPNCGIASTTSVMWCYWGLKDFFLSTDTGKRHLSFFF